MERALTPAEFREVWEAKPALRAVYADYYRRMRAWCPPGGPGRDPVIVEIGAGSGNLKDHLPAVVATDVVGGGRLDVVADAQALPFADTSLDAVVGVDVLHHLEWPARFLAEAERTLRPRGRVVLVEPAITPVSRVVFKLGHPEPVILDVDPLADGTPSPTKLPMDSNQAIPTLLAGRDRARLESRFPGLRVVHSSRLSLFAYPLSGGFRRWCLVPRSVVGPLLRLEARLERRVAPYAGFRLLLVLERVGQGGDREPAASAQ
jgi:SAM-dependent methyltransferase